MHFHPVASSYKALDVHAFAHRNLFDSHPDDLGPVLVTDHQYPSMEPHVWSGSHPHHLPTPPGSRGSLLSELFDHDIPEHSAPHDSYLDHRHQQSAEPGFHGGNWSGLSQSNGGPHHSMHPMRHPHDVAMTRRATFPYVRHDRGEPVPYGTPPYMGSDHDSVSSFGSRPSTMYSEPLSLDGSPHMPMCEPMHHLDEPFAHQVPMNGSPHPPYHDFHHPLDGIKSEDTPVIVPSQNAWSRPSSAGMPQLPCLSPHAGLMVQHTDDAASKETHWRRSTLNPGKIVCNKCGLYERTHLRPRPLRFDELRAGSKTRKQPKGAAGSPKVAKASPQAIKKEPSEMDNVMPRRSSVSSSASSVHSASSDWDESVSVYSGSSNPPSSFNSPAAPTFPIPRDPNSQSPPLAPFEGGIRLPNAPLSDIASLSSGPTPPTPRKAASMPIPYYSSSPAAQQPQQSDYFVRRGSVPARNVESPRPEVTGWQQVPMSEMAPVKSAQSSPAPAAKPILAA
ncbi:uncharacterized protein BXZ73DRAFT_87582 [Epithele typhae]|uniref:uncharacterized protein n=1 Tax=Epithele typhae TaxID=378194 RepID=UPI002008406A|nr:uncharacterized protein BXZ73DRAFT_87582 [Epithele typhae]KAH9943194.1 hypothetical protein BXZ73DRAFT_87582 [Epithele typhae]